MTKGLISFFFNTPVLHHSITPMPKISRTSDNLKIILLLVIIPYFFVSVNVPRFAF